MKGQCLLGAMVFGITTGWCLDENSNPPPQCSGGEMNFSHLEKILSRWFTDSSVFCNGKDIW